MCLQSSGRILSQSRRLSPCILLSEVPYSIGVAKKQAHCKRKAQKTTGTPEKFHCKRVCQNQEHHNQINTRSAIARGIKNKNSIIEIIPQIT
jgi:hypothetical protein